MNAYEICQRHVVTVRRHEELATAAWMMRERNVGCLVVVEPAGAVGGERVVGMLTDRDIVTHVVASNADPQGMIVDDVMARHPVTASSSATIDEARQRMRAAGVRRVPLIDDRGHLAGILALDDIFEYLGQRGAPFVASIVANRAAGTARSEPLARQDWQRQDLHATP